MEKILISVCLVGDPTRFDGGSNRIPELEELNRYYDLVPFCPEMEGGLKCPRDPAEIRGNGVFTKDGKDVTSYYNEGAAKAYALCRYLNIRTVILKEKSPACGTHQIHNGLFDGGVVPGMGIAARFLKAHGIRVISEEEIDSFLQVCRDREARREALIAEREQAASAEAPREEAHEETQEERKPRKPREERRYPSTHHHFNGERKPHENDGDRKPREARFDRKPRKEGEERTPRRDGDRFAKDRGEKRFGHSGKGGFGKKGSFGKKPFSKDRPRRTFRKDGAKHSEE